MEDTLETKLEKKLKNKDPMFLDEIAGLSTDQLNNRLLSLAKNRQETIKAKEEDQDLAEAQATVKDLSAPYKETLSAVDLKMRYIAELIKAKGS